MSLDRSHQQIADGTEGDISSHLAEIQAGLTPVRTPMTEDVHSTVANLARSGRVYVKSPYLVAVRYRGSASTHVELPGNNFDIVFCAESNGNGLESIAMADDPDGGGTFRSDDDSNMKLLKDSLDQTQHADGSNDERRHNFAINYKLCLTSLSTVTDAEASFWRTQFDGFCEEASPRQVLGVKRALGTSVTPMRISLQTFLTLLD